MNLLLDTHVLLWALDAPERLTDDARSVLADPRHRVVVSAASAWEISIKRALGKLRFDGDLAPVLTAVGFDPLPITVEQALAAGGLPAVHSDPFDRMLVAQARAEGLTLVSRDPVFEGYDVATMPA